MLPLADMDDALGGNPSQLQLDLSVKAAVASGAALVAAPLPVQTGRLSDEGGYRPLSPPAAEPAVRHGGSRQEIEAANLARYRAGTLKQRILILFTERLSRSWINDEIATALGETTEDITRRTGELRKDGWLMWRGDDDDERETRRGGHGRVMVLSPQGLRDLV